ncbi:hypothetical protein OB934_07670 [Aeromonas salmonicida]|uniref:hypothetical protein n=1 Tax=Aeromonas salmonicida TaxID=645 RepID=UPI00259DA9D2|nr:hypothetical protein [Aeromonas salmonicida]MDM5062666.1 hypothetical protein [Aeromonas salmonicida]MDM5062674.1 hypothetical protein [Aeromonas salmonicida]
MMNKVTVTKATAILLSLASMSAFAVDDISTAMAPVQTTILGYIAAAGAAGVAIMAVALGWDVGMSIFRKFFKKGAR